MNNEREKTDALSDAVEIDSDKPEGATHTNGKTFYLYEEFYDGEKGEWYRWLKGRKMWSEVLRKPRNIKPI